MVANLQISADEQWWIALVLPGKQLRPAKTRLAVAHLFSVQEIAHVPA
jgi:hypothetical protein